MEVDDDDDDDDDDDGTTFVYAVRRWPKRRYAAHDCILLLFDTSPRLWTSELLSDTEDGINMNGSVTKWNWETLE